MRGKMQISFFAPAGKKAPIDTKTTNDIVDQTWKELTGLRYEKRNRFSSRNISSDIDQASSYFLDAVKCGWRSAGLLYYYSYLNLARAYLASHRKISTKSRTSMSIYHGLKKGKSNSLSILDYEVEIEPPIRNGFTNIFSSFYEVVTKQKWPFSTNITLRISDIIGYSFDIGGELSRLYKIPTVPFEIYSIIRHDQNFACLEFLVPNVRASTVLSKSGKLKLSKHNFVDLPGIPDQYDWRLVYPSVIFNQSLYCVLRSDKFEDNPKKLKKLVNQATASFNNNYAPMPTFTNTFTHWLFMPYLAIHGKMIVWQSLFSEYIIAFALSSILRYQPQILQNGSANSYLMEAWCNESSITALKYFLMLFTDPPIRLQQY